MSAAMNGVASLRSEKLSYDGIITEAACDTSQTYTQHPLSAVYPPLSAHEFQALKDSIYNIGVQNPITLYQGQIIDGWHRYRAATELGLPCSTKELDGDVDLRDYAKSQGARRNLTASQMALVVTAIYKWQPNGANQHKGGNVLSTYPQKSVKELAEIANVSKATIEKAKFVQNKATPEVQAAVKSGEIGIRKAAVIAKLPKEDQAKAIKAPIPKTPNFDSASFVPSDQELAAADAYEAEEVAKIMQIMDSDDRYVAAMDALKRLAKEVIQLRLQRNAMKRKHDKAVDDAKSLRSQLKAIRKIHGEQYADVALNQNVPVRRRLSQHALNLPLSGGQL